MATSCTFTFASALARGTSFDARLSTPSTWPDSRRAYAFLSSGTTVKTSRSMAGLPPHHDGLAVSVISSFSRPPQTNAPVPTGWRFT